MSKYCPEFACEFWEDFPDGYTGKKSKKCPFCRKDFITGRQVNLRQQEVEEHDSNPDIYKQSNDQRIKLIPCQNIIF